ncbi:hypothetical protein DPMN_041784 [Dreissena polymorpha]|uniref:Uncharacterized protein n=1 Tax=Dreissena polymorpha TaxID=45954 RepID=A0A9D4D013_DREPO|nr:hypothetical protein DPMN_041784 [Dreissena polymorpha]
MVGQLRKGIPGMNAMLLMCSLLLAQTMYLISSVVNVRSQSASCVVLGIILHFSWLLVMFEMNEYSNKQIAGNGSALLQKRRLDNRTLSAKASANIQCDHCHANPTLLVQP